MTGEAPKKYTPVEYITVHFPCRQVAGADLGAVKTCIEGIDQFSMLFFQNRFAVRYFFKYLFEHGRDIRHLAHLVICTSKRLAATELLESETPTGIAGMLRNEGLTGQHILLPGAEHVDELVAAQLREGGNEVTPLAVYVHGAQDHVETIDLEFIDEIYFASPSCVQKFREIYESIPSRITITPADERTAAEVRQQFTSNFL